MDVKTWPTLIDTEDLSKRKLTAVYRAPTAEMISYLDFSVSTTGMLAGVKVRVHARVNRGQRHARVNRGQGQSSC